MVNVQGVNNSQTFGRKQIDLNAVKDLQANLAKAGKSLSEADKEYLAKRLTQEKVMAELPKTANFYKFLSDHDGEIQNQLLNGVFTSTLAPTMIFLNPLVKKTDEQKLKTALRQPVSALNSLSFSLAATLAISKIMENAANKGYIASHDLRMNPSDELLTKSFKKQLKEAKKLDKKATQEAVAKLKASGKTDAAKAVKEITKAQDAFLATCEPDAINMIKTIENKKDVIKTYAEKFAQNNKNARKEVFESLMTAKPEDVNYGSLAKGTLKVGEKSFNVKDIPNMTQKSIQKFMSKYNIHNNGIDANDSKAVANYVQKTISGVSENFKNFKKIVNPVIGIPVAVAACYILNAIYPPIRDAVAPSLMKAMNITPDAQKKASVEGGNK